MDTVVALSIIGLVAALPVIVGLLAWRKRRNGFIWAISYAVISYVVGYSIEPRPVLISYGVGLLVSAIPAAIALGFVRPKARGGADGRKSQSPALREP